MLYAFAFVFEPIAFCVLCFVCVFILCNDGRLDQRTREKETWPTIVYSLPPGCLSELGERLLVGAPAHAREYVNVRTPRDMQLCTTLVPVDKTRRTAMT